jgi:small subunit ribosomal protein S8
MAVTDPIADYLTRIRNAQQAGHKIVEIPASGVKRRMTEILYDQGYILKYKFDDEAGKGGQGVIKIALKYDPVSRKPVIRQLLRVSKPGLRKYSAAEDLPRVINGLGIAIVSTSHGLMTDKQARAQHIGGEVLCYVY